LGKFHSNSLKNKVSSKIREILEIRKGKRSKNVKIAVFEQLCGDFWCDGNKRVGEKDCPEKLGS
jgi:hypothetical protein